MGNRVNTALEFLKEGKSFKLDDLRLSMEGELKIIVTGWSRYLNIENISKQIAINELSEIKTLFLMILDSSEEFKNFIKGKKIEYILAFNYGTGAQGICSEIEGQIIWNSWQ